VLAVQALAVEAVAVPVPEVLMLVVLARPQFQ
jgi:hypothetical protein